MEMFRTKLTESTGVFKIMPLLLFVRYVHVVKKYNTHKQKSVGINSKIYRFKIYSIITAYRLYKILNYIADNTV